MSIIELVAYRFQKGEDIIQPKRGFANEWLTENSDYAITVDPHNTGEVVISSRVELNLGANK